MDEFSEVTSETTFDRWKLFFSLKEKLAFLKPLSTPDFDRLKSNSIYIFVHENQKITTDNIFSLDACLGPMWLRILSSHSIAIAEDTQAQSLGTSLLLVSTNTFELNKQRH